MPPGIADHYDRIYSENKHPFGSEPAGLVAEVMRYISSGTAADFGAGDGRNSIFLASKGFAVTAFDISPVAVEKIRERAGREGVTLEANVADITQLAWTGTSGLMVCTVTLHHLSREKALSFLAKMREHTRPRGFHVVTSFMKNGDFYRQDPDADRFYLDEGELRDLYREWEVLTYLEKESQAVAKRADGTPMVNVFAGIIAQNPG